MKTEFFVKYDLYDTTALQDAEETSQSNAEFGNLALMKEDVLTPNYGTLEHNFFVLDGSMEEFPDDPDNLAYFSSGISGEDGTFDREQSVDIQFTENHTSIGITMHFLDVFPMELKIRWYDIYGIFIEEKTFYPDSIDYFCKNQVEEYARIEIIFIKTLPYHNVKLQRLEYGTTITWGSDTIKSASLVRSTDVISDKISMDSLTFEFVDAEEEFNIGNAKGMHRTFQKTQKMFPYEIVDGETVPLGVFFLDGNSTTKNISKISAIDYKGTLDNTNFKNGKIYDGESAGNVIDVIMATAGITDYTVDEETKNTLLYGTLGIQTCRTALREVLFACGSIISTASTTVEIRKWTKDIKEEIPRSRKFSTSYSTDHYVSDVNVKYKTWVLDDKISQLTKGTYPAGIHTIQFSNPAVEITASAGLITESHPYYIILKLDSDEDVVISGKKYISEELSVLSSIEHIKAGEVRNTKTFSGTLLNFESAKRAAENILDYYQLQQIINVRYLSNIEKTGDFVSIENPDKRRGGFVASLESVATDLTGGFISTAKCRGYYKMTAEYYYTGEEIYSGNEVGIL